MKFVKGQSGNLNGRPAGTLNVATRLVKDVFAEVFNNLQQDKKHSLESWAKENKRDFYALVTKLIPVQLDHAGEIVQRIIVEDITHESNPSLPEERDSVQQ